MKLKLEIEVREGAGRPAPSRRFEASVRVTGFDDKTIVQPSWLLPQAFGETAEAAVAQAAAFAYRHFKD